MRDKKLRDLCDRHQRTDGHYDCIVPSSGGKIKLGGVSLREYNEDYGVEDVELAPYLPVDHDDLGRAITGAHYLGYYLKLHPQSCYYHAQENGGFNSFPERTSGTYSKYNSIDDRIDDFHYYTTFMKFGIGRERKGRDVLVWILQAQERGAGQVLMTSIDREGTRKGYDIQLTQKGF